MNKLFARITIEKTEIGAKIRYLESAVLFLSYSYGLSLTYGYLISPMKMKSLSEGKYHL